MTYVGWYFGLGFIVIALLLVLARRDRQDPALPPLWAWFFLIAFWPAWLAVFPFGKHSSTATSEPSTTPADNSHSWLDGHVHEYALAPDELQERLTVREIEAREMIRDPLNAVPDLPFGHLNAAWRRFLDDQVEYDELWSFSTLHEAREPRTGYAKVRDGKPISHFVANRKLLKRE